MLLWPGHKGDLSQSWWLSPYSFPGWGNWSKVEVITSLAWSLPGHQPLPLECHCHQGVKDIWIQANSLESWMQHFYTRVLPHLVPCFSEFIAILSSLAWQFNIYRSSSNCCGFCCLQHFLRPHHLISLVSVTNSFQVWRQLFSRHQQLKLVKLNIICHFTCMCSPQQACNWHQWCIQNGCRRWVFANVSLTQTKQYWVLILHVLCN